MTQHTGLPVHGYRPQTDDAVALVNQHKQLEEHLLRHLDRLAAATNTGSLGMGRSPVDARWLAIARTHVEQAFMAMNRAVFQPARIALPEDAVTQRERHPADASEKPHAQEGPPT